MNARQLLSLAVQLVQDFRKRRANRDFLLLLRSSEVARHDLGGAFVQEPAGLLALPAKGNGLICVFAASRFGHGRDDGLGG